MADMRMKTSLKELISKEKGFLVVAVALVLMPFAINLVTGSGLNSGITKYWEGQFINFFIMAVLAMSYDLLIGYSGTLSFGHAAFFGGGAYTTALLLTHWGPTITENYRIMLPGGVDITSAIIFAVAILAAVLVSLLIGLLFSATSIRLKGAYFAMLTLALGQAIHIITKSTDLVKWTGADEGLHGVPVPAWINPTQFRLRFYFIALVGYFPHDHISYFRIVCRISRSNVLIVEYECNADDDIRSDFHQCPDYCDPGWHRNPNRTDFRRWYHAGVQPGTV